MLIWVVVLSPLAICLANFFVGCVRGDVQKGVEPSIKLTIVDPVVHGPENRGRKQRCRSSIARREVLEQRFPKNLKASLRLRLRARQGYAKLAATTKI